jgi:phosphatidate phosphatase APP1
MTSTFFEQRASYFFANNKKDKHFTVDAIGVVMYDENNNSSIDLDDSDTSSPTSTRSHYFMSSSSSSSSAEDDLGSDSDASEGTSASSTEESFSEDIFHIEKPIQMTSGNDLIIENESEQLVLYQEDNGEEILSQSPAEFDSILAAAAENDQPLPMSLAESSTLADVSHDGTSVVCKTGPSGFFQDNIVIPDSYIDSWSKHAANPRVIRIKATSNEMCSEDCYGLVNLLEPTGISVVSDIDDTIKDTQVLRGAKTVLRNTFFQAARAVDGMAETYKTLYDQGLDFHYVSNSPFQLVSMLKDFLHENSFPLGSFHLRMSGNPLARFTETPGQAKRESVLQIMRDFPERQFIFIGDSGEIDLEIYARIAREHPGRVLKIFIRDVTTSYMQHKATKNSRLDSNDSAPASPRMKISLGPRRLSLGRQSSSNSASPRLEGESYPLHSPLSERPLPRNNSFTSISSSSPSSKKSMIDLFHERIHKAQIDLPEGLIVLFNSADEIATDPVVQEAARQQMELSQ